MFGDFSKSKPELSDNISGVLSQQGRVLLDSDWNDQTIINLSWQIQAAKNIIGPEAAAVPVSTPNAFKIQKAVRISNNEVELSITPGTIWVEGILTSLEGEEPNLNADILRKAYYYGPNGESAGTSRYAVILEVWQDVLNAFQIPDELLEPALGGPDTTERIHTAKRFLLLKLNPDENCTNISDRLKNNFNGKLKVSLEPITITPGDCPVVESGGYSGFEHNLYRIEIAHTKQGLAPMFKWSHVNGGLVGRGKLDSTRKISITANLQAIITAGLSNFYIEIYNNNTGNWEPAYGAKATLTSNNEIQLSAGDIFGITPPPDNDLFFRLWDDIAEINQSIDLKDGIKLEFSSVSSGDYNPGDYWTFKVRAGEAGNKEILIGSKLPDGTITGKLPEGIKYFRVPLAVIDWQGGSELSAESAQNPIEDCRKLFPSLTELTPGCCIAVRPGDDLTRVIEKVKRKGSGCICLLPGNHYLKNPVDLRASHNIYISGFGLASRLFINQKSRKLPPFLLEDSGDISFSSFAIFSAAETDIWRCSNVRGLNINKMFVYSIPARTVHPVIYITKGQSAEWHISENTFIANMGISGEGLYRSQISANKFFGSVRGINIREGLDLRIEENNFIGISDKVLSSFQKYIFRQDGELLNSLYVSDEINKLLTPTRELLAPYYIAVELLMTVDVAIERNHIIGRIGIDLDFIDNCIIDGNKFSTTAFGVNLGLVNGLRFSENIIGQEIANLAAKSKINCEVGLRILSDTANLRILDNQFLKVREGIVFESDQDGKKEALRLVIDDLLFMEYKSDDEISKVVDKSLKYTTNQRAGQNVRKDNFFKVGNCRHIVISRNNFSCLQSGIEWFGTMNIADFIISQNAFSGCQDTAIQIEPEDKVSLLYQPVDIEKRSIENNRFEIYSTAVRSTIGKIRIENNDIYVMEEKNTFPWRNLISIIGTDFLASNKYEATVNDNDVTAMRMMNKELITAVVKEPKKINVKAFSSNIKNRVLSAIQPSTGNSLADRGYILTKLADVNKNDMIITAVLPILNPGNSYLEGFIINLSGEQNRVANNNLYSINKDIPGGIVFHVLSGEVRDNEAAVYDNALLMNASIGSASNRKTEITGNTFIVSGDQSESGKQTVVNALNIPGMRSGGQIIITNNIFDGSVKIGGDPILAWGFLAASKYELVKDVRYNALKIEPAHYNTFVKYEANKYKGNYVVIPPGNMIPLFNEDPHKSRTIVQFADNRIAHGWLTIAQTTGGVHKTVEDLRKQSAFAPVINLSHNTIDYSGKVTGIDLIIVGNHSQFPIQYRAGWNIESAANIPKPIIF